MGFMRFMDFYGIVDGSFNCLWERCQHRSNFYRGSGDVRGPAGRIRATFVVRKKSGRATSHVYERGDNIQHERGRDNIGADINGRLDKTGGRSMRRIEDAMMD